MTIDFSCDGPVSPTARRFPHHVGNSSGINIECEDARHGAGKEVGRLDRQIFERGEMTQRKIHRSTDGSAGREAGRFDRNRASTCHRIDERLRARVPAREHDQLRRDRLAQRSRSHDHAGAAAMPRSSSDVDAHHRAARIVSGSRTPHDEDDLGRFGIERRRDSSRRKRFNDRILHDASELERRSLEVPGRADLHREAKTLAFGKPVVRQERRHEIGKERLEAHRVTRIEIP